MALLASLAVAASEVEAAAFGFAVGFGFARLELIELELVEL